VLLTSPMSRPNTVVPRSFRIPRSRCQSIASMPSPITRS
jgi:hypothetical protein